MVATALCGHTTGVNLIYRVGNRMMVVEVETELAAEKVQDAQAEGGEAGRARIALTPRTEEGGGMTRIMEKCGFTKGGMQSRYYVARGQVHDSVLFGLLREELAFDLDEMISRFHPLR